MRLMKLSKNELGYEKAYSGRVKILSRHDKPRENGGPKGPKVSARTEWVSNPTWKGQPPPEASFA
jgi:hypothetical protein